MDLYNANRLNQNSLCPEPCSFTSIYTSTPSVANARGGNTTATIRMYFNSLIKVFEEYHLQNEMALMGNIGGLIGLILGISLLNLRDVMNKFLDCFEETK